MAQYICTEHFVLTLEDKISFNKHFHSGIATKNIESDLSSFHNTRVETTLSLKASINALITCKNL